MITSLARYRILAALRALDGSAVTRMQLRDWTGCNATAVAAAIAEMTETGLVAKCGARAYTITHQGRAALGRHVAKRKVMK